MDETPNNYEEGIFKPLIEGDALGLMAEDHPLAGRLDHAAVEKRLPADLPPGHRIAWVRVSDLISSGTGHIAGRGIDFETNLARRAQHPAEVTRRAIRHRSASLPPLDAFGRSQSRIGHETLGRS